MIPLRDSVRSRSFPYVNIALIILNVLVFFKQLTLPAQHLNSFFYTYGVIPAQVVNQTSSGTSLIAMGIPFISAMFIHGNWLHLLGNMLYLWIFGDNVEDRMGHLPYLFFYLLVGIIGSIAHIISAPGSEVPIIGASGAIAGILGAYILAFPRARILTLVPVFFFITFIQVPALIFLPIWFLIQILNALSTAGMAAEAVAWWAHIGGFIAGAILYPFFSRYSRYHS
ncbi:rhomboid family intramembrane serine protease [Syntrophaceticus schinkii]|jgi:membrane associated rhomboid family serine protease|uniref:Rhomboid family protein n=1 Tax=Syntrophaceticus schinkii TaxID=499207 RepID=A0A0B7MPS4_9FIRM|nr:rhomboid family intramembrane serine protease [Syntrophaceticus schinkii]CEO89702.1 Rhomboid family protein [Syntrophaceticus schinkii]